MGQVLLTLKTAGYSVKCEVSQTHPTDVHNSANVDTEVDAYRKRRVLNFRKPLNYGGRATYRQYHPRLTSSLKLERRNIQTSRCPDIILISSVFFSTQ